MDHIPSHLEVRCAQLSQAGRKEINEDAIGIRIPEGSLLSSKGIVCVIADGVSTSEAGREASEACVKNLLYDYYCTPDTWTVEKSVSTVLHALNRWLFAQGTQFNQTDKGYICTLSILILKHDLAHIFHVGDSRIYRLREEKLVQLTTDHSRKVNNTSYLARAMGLDSKVQIDYRKEALHQDDLFILSTDGIHDFSDSRDWVTIIKDEQDLNKICINLQETALKNGSEDNLSCQIIKVDCIDETNDKSFFDSLSELPFPPLLKKDQVLDGLKVCSSLHESSRSQLYLVEDVETGKKFVIKTPSPNFSDDPAYIDRFITESWLGKRFRHNKLVQVTKGRIPPTCLYYLMEYVKGVTLEEWMKKNTPCSPEQALRIIKQIALGLRYLHRQQVIHQDLKPGNILIDSNEQIKLIDYGSCYVHASQELPARQWTPEQALGTATYSAPECALGKRVEYASDQFSLAVILYELLSGTLPYRNQLENLTQEKQLQHLEYRELASKKVFVPIWFDQAIKKALSPLPDKRFGDIDEFIYQLEHGHENFSMNERLPLIDTNPIRFWQGVALIQALILAILIAHLLK